MVRELVEVLLCDVDRTRDARTWRIVDPDGNAVELDLCDLHARPLVKIYAEGHAAARPEQQQAHRGSLRATSRVEVIEPMEKR